MTDENTIWLSGNRKEYTQSGSYYMRQYIFHSSDRGRTWEKQWDSVLNKLSLHEIEFYDKDFGLASSRQAEVLFTEDGGKTWKAEYITGEKPSGYERIVDNIQIPNRNTIYVLYGSRHIYKWTRSTTSAAEQSQSPGISITPNPATDYIDVMLSEAKEPFLSVKVYDILGVCVLTHPLAPSREGETIRIDVSGLAAGVYFVRVGGRMYKFVKM
jgi:hypothetical protein